MCQDLEVSGSNRDAKLKHDKLGAECWVWHKDATTMRVTLWTSVPGESRMFDVTKRGIQEVEE